MFGEWLIKKCYGVDIEKQRDANALTAICNQITLTNAERYMVLSTNDKDGVSSSVIVQPAEVGFKQTSTAANDAKSWCSSYGDGKWYLPNNVELKTIYNNKSVLNNTLSTCGGTTLGTSHYWSSDYAGNSYAYYVDFSNGSITSTMYTGNIRTVRAVRAL